MATRSLLPYSWFRQSPAEWQRDPFAMLRQEMNRVFENFGNVPETRWNDITPRIDVSETDKEVDIEAELPGIDEKDVDVTLSGDVLTIRGERKDHREEKNKNYYVSERSYGSFTRSVTLPFDADPKNVSAKFDKGVLHIVVPKPPEVTTKAAKIPVKAA